MREQEVGALNAAKRVLYAELQSSGDDLVTNPDSVGLAIDCIRNFSPEPRRKVVEQIAREKYPLDAEEPLDPYEPDAYEQHILDFLASKDTTPPH